MKEQCLPYTVFLLTAICFSSSQLLANIYCQGHNLSFCPSFRPLSPKAPCTEGMLGSMDIPFCALSLHSDDCRNLPLAFLLRLFSLKHLQLPYHCQLPRLLLLFRRYDLFTFECYLTCEMAVYSRRMSHSTQRRLNIGSFFKSKIRIPVKSPRILIVILLKVN